MFVLRKVLIVLIVYVYGLGLLGLFDKKILFGLSVNMFFVDVCVGIMVNL